MKIENLSKELDRQTMATVTGGDNGNSANNVIGQQLNIVSPVCVQGCGPTNSSVNVTGTQNAGVWSEQFGGDSYIAGLFPGSFGRQQA